MLDAVKIGHILHKFREDKNISQEVLSGLADIGRTHLSMIERGERKPALDTLFKLCDALEIPPHIVVEEIEKSAITESGDNK